MFDNFIVKCEGAARPVEPVNAPQECSATDEIVDMEFQELKPQESSVIVPTNYSQDELDAAVTRATQQGYENGFKAASGDQEQAEQQLLQSMDNKLMALLTDVENYKKQLEQDSLRFSTGVIRKILPGLEQERAGAEVEHFLTENFPSFRKEAALSFSFNPEVAGQAAGLLGKLADRNDFEGKIAVHKDSALGLSDVRVEWENGGVERCTDNLLAKVDNLLDDNPNEQGRENG